MPIGIDLFPDIGGITQMPTDKKEVIKSIIHIFETGKAHGDYSSASVLTDGAGISYGASQATDKADSLDAIVFAYRDASGLYAKEFDQYIQYLASDATATLNPKALPDWCKNLIALLKKAGTDPIMKKCQDDIFDTHYWVPAAALADQMKLTLPLSRAIVYDTCIHSGPGGVAKIRKLFPESPPSSGGDEKKWAVAYVKARKNWLLAFSNPLVQKTSYRMEAFQHIIDNGNWELETPLVVRSVTIS